MPPIMSISAERGNQKDNQGQHQSDTQSTRNIKTSQEGNQAQHITQPNEKEDRQQKRQIGTRLLFANRRNGHFISYKQNERFNCIL